MQDTRTRQLMWTSTHTQDNDYKSKLTDWTSSFDTPQPSPPAKPTASSDTDGDESHRDKVNGLPVLRMLVTGKMYEVMDSEVGGVGEKHVEYKADTEYWRRRLFVGGDVDQPKKFSSVRVYNSFCFDDGVDGVPKDRAGAPLSESR